MNVCSAAFLFPHLFYPGPQPILSLLSWKHPHRCILSCVLLISQVFLSPIRLCLRLAFTVGFLYTLLAHHTECRSPVVMICSPNLLFSVSRPLTLILLLFMSPQMSVNPGVKSWTVAPLYHDVFAVFFGLWCLRKSKSTAP